MFIFSHKYVDTFEEKCLYGLYDFTYFKISYLIKTS